MLGFRLVLHTVVSAILHYYTSSKKRCSMAVAMQYGGGAMQYEHIVKIAAHVLDRGDAVWR